jgi:cytoskeletal protein CcmA (bactofilin family)
MKKTILAVCFIILLLPLTAAAYNVKTGDSVYLAKNQTIDGNLYAASANITIDGQVKGDVICAAQSININGQVAGDVICAGQSININGQIGGSLRLAGNAINLNGQVAHNGLILGATITTSADSSLGWDLLALGGLLESRGSIGRNLSASLGKATLAGPIGENVNLNFSQRKKTNATPLTIAGTAKINGDVKYTAAKDALVENGAVIKGEITHNLPKTAVKKFVFFGPGWWWGNLIAIFSALVVGLVLVSLWRQPLVKTTDLMLDKVSVSLGWGVLVLLLTLPLAVILLITIIGIPLSLILTTLWLIALYISKILVGVLVGRNLLSNLWPAQKDSLILGMIVGIIVMYLIFALPFIGWLASLLAVLWGLGGIILTLRRTAATSQKN